MAQLHAITWNDLPDINDAEPFGEADEACLDELHQVLEKHGQTHRLGIALLHSHFEVANDEMLVEEIDIERRTLTTRPQKVSNLNRDRLRPTIWRFDKGVKMACSYCPTDAKGGHHGYKESH